MIKEIIEKTTSLGACKLTDGICTWEELISLFFRSQGLEFCQKKNFPTKEVLAEIDRCVDKAHLGKLGVHINAGVISYEGDGNIALIGETQGELRFNSNDRISRLVLMCGAKAHVVASDFAVLDIRCDKDSSYEIEADKTVILL